MNRIYRSIWNDKLGTFVAAAENARSGGKKPSSGTSTVAATVRFALNGLTLSLALAFSANGYALPTDGAIAAGSANIASGAARMTVSQSSQNVAINWQSFSIGQGESVQFVQPNSSSVALNRVLGADPSSILGSLSANGKVFLVNPNGVLFGKGASVNVGGLVASTLNISDVDFMAGVYKFSGAGTGPILNQGSIKADGGYVALLGANISNEGVISARLGSVVLAAGNAMTLDIAGDGLLNVAVSQGAVSALAQNGGLIQADGGQVLLTAQAAGNLLPSVVNNTGVIQAQTLENHNGTIRLLGDMQSGSVNVGGKLDASALNGGDGGFIETSAAHVNIADSTISTTLSTQGHSGTWLIDPSDFTIAATGGNISGATLSTNLSGGPISILSSAGTVGGAGDINVNDAVSWSSNLLTLTAARDININAVMTASGTATLAMNTATANGADGAVAGGAVKVGMNSSGFTGRVDFPSRNGGGILTINGLAYIIVDLLGASTTTTVTDLQGMKSGLASNYALGTNIDATATSGWNAGAGFVPVGAPGTPFTGKFNGLGHTITGLTINRGGTASVGLFGASDTTSSFRNVGLVLGSVVGAAGTGGLVGTNAAGSAISNSYNTGSVSGAAGTGGLVGDNTTATTSNSFTTGNVTGAAGTGGLLGTNTTGAVSNSYATGIVIGSGAGTGGLVGSNTTGAVSKSFASGNVTGGGADTGGLLGSTGANVVSDSYATGNVSGTGAGTGGLIGTSIGTVTTSYSAGSVSASGGTLGGLVGVAGAGSVTNSFWDTTTSLQGSSAGGGIGMTTANMKQQANFTSATVPNGGVNPNWNFATTWVMYNGITYPLLRPFMTPLTVTANADAKVYNGLAYSGGNGVTYSSVPNVNLLGAVTYSGTSQGAVNVGSYVITPGGLYSNQLGYLINYVSGALGVTAAPLGIAANGATRLYGDANPAFSATYTGFQNGETAAVLTGTLALATSASAASSVGSYAIVPSGQSSTNYTITYVNGALGVLSAPLGIAANSTSKVFGTTLSFAGTEFTSTGLKNGETVGSVTLTSPGAVSTAGVLGSPYAITPSAATGGNFSASNYTITYVDGSLGVIPSGLLGIAANSAVKTYDGLAYSGGNGVVYTGFQGGDTPASLSGTLVYGGSSQGAVNVGNYTIIPSGQSSPNYTITYVNGNLGVIAAPLGIAANSATRLYGAANPVFSATYNGFQNGETAAVLTGTLALTTPAVPGSSVGSYVIVPSGQSSSNYTITYVDGILGVTPAPLGIVANSATRLYGGINPTFSATYNGFQNGDTVAALAGTLALATSAGPTSSVGNYAIVPSGHSATNYTISYVNGVLVVTPAELIVTAADVTTIGGQIPPLTGFTTVGLLNGETVGSVTETTTATPASSPAGNPYPITPSNAAGGTFAASNYAITYVDGELTVGSVLQPTATLVDGTISHVNLDDWVTLSPVPPDFTGPDGLNLVVVGTGVLMPPIQLALVPSPRPVPPAQPVSPAPLVAPVLTPAKPYVAPLYPLKQDRN